ncbi:MAG TPA: hypothetical protein VK674_00430 [Candidatus Limnocylindria bacterium]|nr:hypothetical protein [Candidatus Limnocylindria bacterium]
MPGKAKSSKKTSKSKKLSKLPWASGKSPLFAATLVVFVVAVLGGVYTLRSSQALGQVCNKDSSPWCSPSVDECLKFMPTLREEVPPRTRNGCTAAIQAFYRYLYHINITVDGLFGPKTRDITKYYQASRSLAYVKIAPTGFLSNRSGDRSWVKVHADCMATGRMHKVCTDHYRYR